MRNTQQYVITLLILGSLAVMVLVTFPMVVVAELRPQEISGTVAVTQADEQDWTPLTKEMVVQAGETIKTGVKSAVGLHAADGSVLFLDEDTQLTIEKFDFSEAEKTRVLQFRLLQGMVTAEATTLEFQPQKNTFVLLTDIVRLTASPEDRLVVVQVHHDPGERISEVFTLTGKVTINQINEGTLHFTGLLTGNQRAHQGLVFWRESPEIDVILEVLDQTSTIIVASSTTLELMSKVLSSSGDMQVTNLAESLLLLTFPKSDEDILLKARNDLTVINASPEEIFEIEALKHLQAAFRFLPVEVPVVPPAPPSAISPSSGDVVPKPRPTEPSGSPILP